MQRSTDVSVSYDDALRITGITDNGNSTLSWAYDYDSLDRVSSASNAAQSLAFTYDADGNRLMQSGSSNGTSANATFSIAGASNRLSSVTGMLSRTYSYDAAGHTSAYGGVSFIYNAAGRLLTAVNGSASSSYIYNALDQRVQKTTAAGSTVFLYDESGHLLGEYDGTGNAVEEIVWLGDIPVATVRQEACGLSIFYIHTDHLNTPRRITRRSTSDVVWSWDGDLFGSVGPNENPSGLGTFSFNLRFPGQYYDVETGLNYNYFRNYDPATGRYAESDPIGLRGGLNTYAYVGGNPVTSADPYGLWSTNAHNAIIQEYGKEMGLPPNIIQAMEQGLYDADHGDGNQDAEHSFMHAMSSSALSKAQACKMLNAFVADAVKTANALASIDPLEAAWDLGFGLHAIMDSTSPVHSGFQKWNLSDAWKHGPFPTSKEDVDSLTPALLQQTINLMNSAVGGKPLDCSCYAR